MGYAKFHPRFGGFDGFVHPLNESVPFRDASRRELVCRPLQTPPLDCPGTRCLARIIEFL